MQVTDAMVYAAKKQMAAAWGEEHIRAALKAALDECFVDEDGAHGPADATGSVDTITLNYPVDPGSWGNDIPAFMEVASLAGVKEIAEALNTPRATVSAWIQKRGQNGFPLPVKSLGMGALFHLGVVKSWHEAQKSGGDDSR